MIKLKILPIIQKGFGFKINKVFLIVILFYIFGCQQNKIDIYITKAIAIHKNFPNRKKIDASKAKIGHLLFFDKALSFNQSKACASCHNPNLFFTDGYKQAIGLYADVQDRNTPSIINNASYKTLNWANPSVTSFEQQMQTPLFSKQHFEMGMSSTNEAQAINIFKKKDYKKLELCTQKENKNWNFIIDCISSYLKLLESRNSVYDQFLKTKGSSILSANQLAGMQLFFSEKLHCASCHGGIDFNSPIDENNYFSNNQLFSTEYYKSQIDKGLYNETKNKNDIGKWRIPSLRNVMNTYPYMHNGTFANMNMVVEAYSKRNKFSITTLQKNQLIDFLETLTDSTIFTNKIFIYPNF
jgi:cytochrome c peroxidase